MLLCFGFRTKLVPETAARMLFAGWASFVIEDINGEIKVCGDYSPEEASLVETFCSKYSKSSEPGSQGLKANSLKFLGQEALQGFLTSTGEVFVKSNKDSGDEKLRGGPCLLLLSNIKDVATCGQSANHWTVAIDRSTGGLFEWIATDLRPRVVTLASSLNPLLPSSSASNPTLVSKTKFKRVWAGEAHMLVLAEDGTLYSWGRGRHGQLGHGDLGFESVPRPIEALQGLRIIDAACGASFSVALSESGDIYTFGLNDHGQLGIGKGADFDRGSSQEWESQTPKHNTAYPQLVDFYDSDSGKELDVHVVKVACGRAHTVVLDDQGGVWSCGWGKYGQLCPLPPSSSTLATSLDMDNMCLETREQQMLYRMGCTIQQADQYHFVRVKDKKSKGAFGSTESWEDVVCGPWNSCIWAKD